MTYPECHSLCTDYSHDPRCPIAKANQLRDAAPELAEALLNFVLWCEGRIPAKDDARSVMDGMKAALHKAGVL